MKLTEVRPWFLSRSKNIPVTIYEKLKKTAAANRRSVNDEVIAIIEQGLNNSRLDPDGLLPAAKRIRGKTAGSSITEAELDQMKRVGRG